MSRGLLEKLRFSTSIDADRFVATWCLKEHSNPFLVLVGVILSQNTSDVNALRALKELVEAGLTCPERVLEAGRSRIMELIRPSGMQSQKTDAILELARACKEGLKLDELCRESPEKARAVLTSLRGIGRKTADVFLASYCGAPVFPVDRHILRVTSRVLGRRVSYNEASEFWARVFEPQDYYEAHLRLIEVGRTYCKPAWRDCSRCPLKTMCREAGGTPPAPQS